MRIIDQLLYLEMAELTECGVSSNTVWQASARKSPSWDIISHPDDGRKILVGFDRLRQDYKEKVLAHYGNPYQYVAKDPIRKMIPSDLEAEKFYLAYRYDGDKKLPEDRIRQYTREACWMNMLCNAEDNMKEIRKGLGLRMEDFYKNACEIIQLERTQGRVTKQFPSTYVNIKARMRAYKETRYESLISDHYGNKRAAKVNDELAGAMLLELAAQPNQYDDVFVAMNYNRTAVERGYKPITPRTVGEWRRKNAFLITAQREGLAAFDDKFRKQIPGRRPSAPLYLVESDDNHLDLFFIDLEDVTSSKHYRKYKAMVVVDSYCDYPLGYAYAEEITVELVKAAWVNAMYHIRELTGGWYLPHESRTDNWGIKSLQPFYESIGHYVNSPVGSKKRGYIEQLFGKVHWKNCLKLGAVNYTGNNITAKRRGVNQEQLAANKKMYPTVGQEAYQQIEQVFHRIRTMPESNLKSKQDRWLEGWNKLPDSEKRPITDEQFLLKFGIQHNANNRRITITNMGIAPEIGGTRLLYDVPAHLHLETIGKAVDVIYDPADLSRILVTDQAGLRFVASTAQLAPKALRDYQQGDRTHLNALLAQKKEQSKRVADAGSRRKELLYEAGIDPENLLIGGVMEKQLKQMAEVQFQAGERYLPGHTEPDDDYDPLDQM